MLSLTQLPVALRALFSSFLMLIGIGYLMALSYLFLVLIEPHQKMGMGVVTGIEMQYHGDPTGSRIEAAMRGAMADRINAADRDRILTWVHLGSPGSGYATVKPIFEKNCVMCHSAASGLPVPPLTTLQEIQQTTKIDTGPSIAQLARVSHVHLFGISIIFFLTGGIFALSAAPVWFRVTMLVLPYLSIIADIGSWWLTKFHPGFGIVVLIGGVVMGLALGVQIVFSLWEMWLPAPYARASASQRDG